MTNKIYTLDEIKDIVSPIASRYGLDKVFLFGSYAKGSATPDSDIDLRIDKGLLKGLFALGGLYNELSNSFEKKLDLLTTGSLDEAFLQRIASEEILVYEHQ